MIPSLQHSDPRVKQGAFPFSSHDQRHYGDLPVR
jgi:hypothetical protein